MYRYFKLMNLCKFCRQHSNTAMGKKGSALLLFLIEGLKRGTYGDYLRYVGDKADNVFRVTLPRKSKNICREYDRILKDWNSQKGHEVGDFDYTRAKQRFTAALRRSVYLEPVLNEPYRLTYKILSSEKIKEKRKLRNKNEKSKDLDCYSPTAESGYGSCKESPSPSHQSSDTHDLFLDCERDEESQLSPNNCNSQSSNFLEANQQDPFFGFPSDESIAQDPEISLSVAVDETTPTDSGLFENSSLNFAADLTDEILKNLEDDLACSPLHLFDDLLSGNKGIEQVLGETFNFQYFCVYVLKLEEIDFVHTKQVLPSDVRSACSSDDNFRAEPVCPYLFSADLKAF